MTTFALLDDTGASGERPTSRLYEGFVHEQRCVDPAELDATWARVDADLRAGLHAVLLADYEWGAKLLKAGHAALAADDPSALRVLMFRRLVHLSRDEVETWLDQHGASGTAGVMDLQPSVGRAEFTDAIGKIHAAIQAGETYQINYTYRLRGQAYGEPLALYRQLRRRQPVAYGAFIVLPEGGAVVSCSPELFLRHEAGRLTARPMKGTAPRIAAPESDSETARLLSLDIKNRAENLMIVDLLRNDLGRISRIGSVKVPALFAIEPYATVFQMTSTVQSQLLPELGFADLLRAVFPCGSITGAPKHHTMELIAGLESTPRGLYCGAIGWVDAPAAEARVGDFCLSVAIRTLTLGRPEDGLRPARLGIGAGIVLDSRADDEFDECLLKARFLTGLDPGFELFETLLWTPDAGLHHVGHHLARLGRSARNLGFAFDEAAARVALSACARSLPAEGPARLRLALAHGGRLSLRHGPLAPLPEAGVSLLVATHTLPNANPLAAHKTTLRPHYDAGVREAEQVGAFDSLFFTHDGRLVEGGRSSVFLKLAGRWYTPPVAAGALPGVMRGLLLQDPAWAAQERTLRWADLQRAEAIVVCNALRGPLKAKLHTVDALRPRRERNTAA
ncbi:MAG TPA: aminodeoxychorismate synthase component I [Ideonella sp.]|nr:aminodeoxychorismate synthase component I [Ideonella sp.]